MGAALWCLLNLGSCPAAYGAPVTLVDDKWVLEELMRVLEDPPKLATGQNHHVVMRASRRQTRYFLQLRTCFTYCQFVVMEVNSVDYGSARREEPWPRE